MRTTVNFQYRYGMSSFEAIKHLYAEGGGGLSGVRRFYRGVGPALIQGPLSRFGDTAANAGMMALWDSFEVRPQPCRCQGWRHSIHPPVTEPRAATATTRVMRLL